jgi:hypothetical protein
LISLVKNNCLNGTEVDVASFDMIQNSTGSSDKEVNTLTEFTRLVFDRDTSIHSHSSVLVVVHLQLVELSGTLQSQFASRSEYDCLDFSVTELLVFSQALNDREAKGKSFS